MHTRKANSVRPELLACLPLLLILSACGPGADATPTLSLDGIATSAYLTFTAELATKQALATPTDTPAPSPSPMPTLPPPSPLPTLALSGSTPLVAAADANCDDSTYIADVTIPDNTKLDPGKKFTKTWRVQNTGTCVWSTGYKVTFIDGLKMDGSGTFVPLPVPVGQQTEMSVEMRAPTTPGQYYGRWKMTNEKDQTFGSFLTVVIKVISLTEATP